MINGIEKERELLKEIKSHARHIIDTSHIQTRLLREKLTDIFVENKGFDNLIITVLSFGYKFGIPEDSDLVLDVRFIPNPFYLSELKEQTGLDGEVKEYVLSHEVSRVFLAKTADMLGFLIPNYIKEGKNQLVISIGCTGGKHRSVALTEELSRFITEMGRNIQVRHRDIRKDV